MDNPFDSLRHLKEQRDAELRRQQEEEQRRRQASEQSQDANLRRVLQYVETYGQIAVYALRNFRDALYPDGFVRGYGMTIDPPLVDLSEPPWPSQEFAWQLLRKERDPFQLDPHDFNLTPFFQVQLLFDEKDTPVKYRCGYIQSNQEIDTPLTEAALVEAMQRAYREREGL
jgi:hypothetical protein